MYVVKVADNFHYMDESETYTLGTFETWDEALAAAKKVVDDCLAHHYQTGLNAEDLYSSYKGFGEDPYIPSAPDGEHFSAWDYAKARCNAICAE